MKLQLFLFFVTCSAFGANFTSLSYVQDGLAAHFDGIENAGRGVHDNAAKVWKDLTGNKNDAKASDKIKWCANGFTNADVARPMVTTTELTKLLATEKWTIEILVKPSREPQRETYLGNWNIIGFGIERATNANLRAYFNGAPDIHTKFGDIAKDETASITVTSTGYSQTLFKNGEFAATHQGVTDSGWGVERPLVIGGESCRDNMTFFGTIFACRFYGRVLTTEEIMMNRAVDEIRYLGATAESVNIPQGYFFEDKDGVAKVGLHPVTKKPRAKHFVFIGLDGLRGNFLKEEACTNAPTILRMMREGAWTLNSRSILPSSSAANWHSIFTCSPSEIHGYNDWDSRKPVMKPDFTESTGLFPDVFARFRRQNPNAKIGYFYEWDGMAFVINTNVCNVSMMVGLQNQEPFEYLKNEKPELFALVYDQPDTQGHIQGFNSQAYNDIMPVLDATIERCVKICEENGTINDTIFMVSSDHGGIGKGHGGTDLQEMQRPVILWGKGIKRGHQMFVSSTVYDTGATIAEILGIEPLQIWVGRPLLDAFTSF